MKSTEIVLTRRYNGNKNQNSNHKQMWLSLKRKRSTLNRSHEKAPELFDNPINEEEGSR